MSQKSFIIPRSFDDLHSTRSLFTHGQCTASACLKISGNLRKCPKILRAINYMYNVKYSKLGQRAGGRSTYDICGANCSGAQETYEVGCSESKLGLTLLVYPCQISARSENFSRKVKSRVVYFYTRFFSYKRKT